MLGTGKAAEKYGLSKHVVRKLAEAGKVLYVQTAGGHFKIDEVSLRKYLGLEIC